jgi:hypothetical protein
MEKFAKKCSISGLGINSGFCFFDGETIIKDEYEAIKYAKRLGYKSLDDAYEASIYYWTEWEIEEGEDCYNEQGELIITN